MMDGGEATGVMEPFSGRVRKISGGAGPLLTWLDSARLVHGERMLTVMDAEKNPTSPRDLRWVQVDAGETVFSLAPAPPNAPGPLIASVGGRGRAAVTFFRKDLTPGKRVWVAPGPLYVSYPRVDPMGEFVAWTDQAGGRRTMIKGVNEPVTKAPSLITLPGYTSVYFCDWTDQGTLLGNATRDGRNWTLVLFTRDGKLIRRLETNVPPAQGVIASWRKYGHR